MPKNTLTPSLKIFNVIGIMKLSNKKEVKKSMPAKINKIVTFDL
jgi:hypothetical protein